MLILRGRSVQNQDTRLLVAVKGKKQEWHSLHQKSGFKGRTKDIRNWSSGKNKGKERQTSC